MVKFLQGELSAADIIHIAAYDKSIRTAINPFGRSAYRSRYGGRAVSWKLMRKASGESTSAYLTRLAAVNAGVSAGLANAIAMSKKHTEKGVAAVIYSDGSTGIMPVKAAKMGMEGKNHTVAEIMGTYGSARSAAYVVQPTGMKVTA